MAAKGLCALFAGALVIASPSARADDDVVKQIINDPHPAAFTFYGQSCSQEIRKDPAVQWGQALRATVTAKGVNPWDCGLMVKIVKPVKAGDKIILAFWAKLVSVDGGATSVVLPNNSVQLAQAPYASFMNGPTEIGSEWKVYSLEGHADRDYKVGEITAAFQLAGAKQVIDFGPIFVLDRGPAQ